MQLGRRQGGCGRGLWNGEFGMVGLEEKVRGRMMGNIVGGGRLDKRRVGMGEWSWR